MEEKILPALEAVPGLSALLLKMNLQGYDYRRDDEFMMWGSADLLWKIYLRDVRTIWQHQIPLSL